MLEQSVIDAAKQDALEKYPNESCGIVVANTYIACTNTAENPAIDFKIENSEINSLTTEHPLQAVIHSHPKNPLIQVSAPSKADMQAYLAGTVPWGIIDTDGEIVSEPYWLSDENLNLPLIGVSFHAGIADCFSLVRRFYYQRRNILLQDVARGPDWWEEENASSLFLENFETVGFSQLDGDEELLDGDVLLFRINSAIINHSAIYLSNQDDGIGLILHHLGNRLSAREPAMPWLNRAELRLRYVM